MWKLGLWRPLEIHKSSSVRVGNINLIDLRICEVRTGVPQLPKCSNDSDNMKHIKHSKIIVTNLVAMIMTET